jgi:signal peptidase I
VYVEAWDAAAAAHRPAPPRRAVHALRDLFQVALIAGLLFAGTRTVVQGREVRGPSMLPAYHQGQRLFITRYVFDGPNRGDVVVFHPPTAGKDD